MESYSIFFLFLIYNPTSLFENLVVADTIKWFTNRGERPELYYWRDKTGREVDLIIEQSGQLLPIEIKSGMTYQEQFSKNLKPFMKLSGAEQAWILYGGKEEFSFSSGLKAMNWMKFGDVLG